MEKGLLGPETVSPEEHKERAGTTVRPDMYLRRRINRLRSILSEAAGEVTFNKFAVAALEGHCDKLEAHLGLPALPLTRAVQEGGGSRHGDLDRYQHPLRSSK